MNEAAPPASLQQLVDRAAILELLHLWCRAIDRCDRDLLRHVFHDDALFENGSSQVPVRAYLARAFERHESIPKASHMIGTVLVEFTGSDSAFSEAYCHALEFHPGSGGRPDLDRLVRMRYGDVFERREGLWKIAHRISVIDHEAWQPAPAADTAQAARRLVGARNDSDPVLRMRRSLLMTRA